MALYLIVSNIICFCEYIFNYHLLVSFLSKLSCPSTKSFVIFTADLFTARPDQDPL